MFLIGSPGREVNNLLIEAAEAPQRSLKVRPLPSQEVAYHPWPWLAMLFEVVNVQSQYTSPAYRNQASGSMDNPLGLDTSWFRQAQPRSLLLGQR